MKMGKIGYFSFSVVALYIMVLAPALLAQPNSEKKGYLRGTLGYSKTYLDEPGGMLFSGSVLFKLSPHWGVEPEVLWIDGNRFEHKGFAVNCVYDFQRPDQRVRPYLIAGLGYVRETDVNYEQNKMTWNGGVGVRIRLHKGLFVAPEVRIGSQAFPRLTASVGYEF